MNCLPFVGNGRNLEVLGPHFSTKLELNSSVSESFILHRPQHSLLYHTESVSLISVICLAPVGICI